MKRTLVTLLALMALTATAVGAVRVTDPEAHAVCVPPAVIQALS
jgi:hypothetical protein